MSVTTNNHTVYRLRGWEYEVQLLYCTITFRLYDYICIFTVSLNDYTTSRVRFGAVLQEDDAHTVMDYHNTM